MTDFETLAEKLAAENQKLREDVEFLRGLMDDFVKRYEMLKGAN